MAKSELLVSIAVSLVISSCGEADQSTERPSRVATSRAVAPEAAHDEPGCPVTRANNQGYVTPTLELRHGNEWLATNVYPDGTVDFRPGGAGCVDGAGALWVKWPWWRKVAGALEVETSHLDGSGAPLKAETPCCYDADGFQPAAVGFPGSGCWRVTARVGDGALSFVTRVESHGDGPRRCDPEGAAQREDAADEGAGT
jgi:hypothetical protein